MCASSIAPIGTPITLPMMNGATLRQASACRSFQTP